jgi:hypothetical protein
MAAVPMSPMMPSIELRTILRAILCAIVSSCNSRVASAHTAIRAVIAKARTTEQAAIWR